MVRGVQEPGAFVVIFSGGYHSGFSHGFNVGEAVNFATPDWFKAGFSSLPRYSALARRPIIDHDANLCKEMGEAMQRTGTRPQDDETMNMFVARYKQLAEGMEEIVTRKGCTVEVRDDHKGGQIGHHLCLTQCHMAFVTRDSKVGMKTCLSQCITALME